MKVASRLHPIYLGSSSLSFSSNENRHRTGGWLRLGFFENLDISTCTIHRQVLWPVMSNCATADFVGIFPMLRGRLPIPYSRKCAHDGVCGVLMVMGKCAAERNNSPGGEANTLYMSMWHNTINQSKVLTIFGFEVFFKTWGRTVR